MLPIPLSKIKKNFCCHRSLCAGLFKILNFFLHFIQCWKIFPGIWYGDECLYFSIVFAVLLLLLLTTLCTLRYAFLHWRPRPFPIFPLSFSFVWFAMNKLSLWELQRAVLCWKHRFPWLCLDIFWEPGGWMLFTECYLQTCLNGFSLNSQLRWIYTLYGWGPCNK